MLLQLFYVDILYINILYVSMLYILISLIPFSASHLPHIIFSIPIPSFLLPIKKIYKRKPPLPLSAPGLAPSLRSSRPPSLRPARFARLAKWCVRYIYVFRRQYWRLRVRPRIMRHTHVQGTRGGGGMGRSSSAGMGWCGCGGLAVTECWAVTECELCTVHKLGASPGAGVIGGYGGVTEGLRRG